LNQKLIDYGGWGEWPSGYNCHYEFDSGTQVTYGFMVPPMMLMLAQHPLVSEYKFSSLSRIAVAAAPVSPLIIEKVHERLNNPNLLAKQGNYY